MAQRAEYRLQSLPQPSAADIKAYHQSALSSFPDETVQVLGRMVPVDKFLNTNPDNLIIVMQYINGEQDVAPSSKRGMLSLPPHYECDGGAVRKYPYLAIADIDAAEAVVDYNVAVWLLKSPYQVIVFRQTPNELSPRSTNDTGQCISIQRIYFSTFIPAPAEY